MFEIQNGDHELYFNLNETALLLIFLHTGRYRNSGLNRL